MILDKNNNNALYSLDFYEIKRNRESIVITFGSNDFEVVYELRPDVRFPSLDDIIEYLEQVLKTAISKGYTCEYLIKKK